MAWFSASDPSQNTILSGLVSRAASSTQASIGVATVLPPKIYSAASKNRMDAPDPARPHRMDLYLRLAGHSRTVQTCPVYVTGNPGGKFAGDPACYDSHSTPCPSPWNK